MADKISSKPASADDIARVIAWTKENAAKLKLCPLHNFKPEDPSTALTQYRCTACGGVVSGEAARWFAIGLTQGRAT